MSAGWANLLTLAAALAGLPAGPFVHVGTVDLANAALSCRNPGLRAFLDAGRRGYLPTLVGSLAVGAGAVFAGSSGGAAPPGETAAGGVGTFVAVTLGVVALVLLLSFLITLLVHRYAHTAVVDGTGALDCVLRSARVVPTGGRTTLGYAAVTAPSPHSSARRSSSSQPWLGYPRYPRLLVRSPASLDDRPTSEGHAFATLAR